MFGAAPSMLRVVVIIVILVVCRAYVSDQSITVTPVGRHSGIWAVKFKASSVKSYGEIAEEYAIQHDLINKGVVGELEDTYEFVLPSKHQGILHKRELLEEYATKLKSDHVRWFEHQQVLKRITRTVMFDDPEYNMQWHLVCDVCLHMYMLCACVFVCMCVCVYMYLCTPHQPTTIYLYVNRQVFTVVDYLCTHYYIMSLLLSAVDTTVVVLILSTCNVLYQHPSVCVHTEISYII